MPHRSRWVRRGMPLLLGAGFALLLSACGDSGDSDSTRGELAERWLRAGEESNAAVAVYDGELPPHLTDLLNPDRTEETPDEDLLAFPVHPEGDLLGSYSLRRADGSQILWLFYDVAGSTLQDTTGAVIGQLDTSPWQVVSESGSRSNRILAFQSTSNEEITGSVIIEPVAASSEFTLVVDRDGEEVTLTPARSASVPLVEAALADDLVVEDVFPGAAQTAGLRDGDRIVRVGETEVGTERELQQALESLAAEPETISLLYVIQFAPPLDAELPPFVPADGLQLPEDFPLHDLWQGFTLDRFESGQNPQVPSSELHIARLFSPDTTTAVADQIRGALGSAGWEIVTDEAQGTGTMLEFSHEGEGLLGVASIDQSPFDQSLTEVFVSFQTAPPTGG